jgi:hypothetical protein
MSYESMRVIGPATPPAPDTRLGDAARWHGTLKYGALDVPDLDHVFPTQLCTVMAIHELPAVIHQCLFAYHKLNTAQRSRLWQRRLAYADHDKIRMMAKDKAIGIDFNAKAIATDLKEVGRPSRASSSSSSSSLNISR